MRINDTNDRLIESHKGLFILSFGMASDLMAASGKAYGNAIFHT